MDIKVKSEPIEDESSEAFQINAKIKEENELIIESDVQWLPTKFENEENEYYQEFIQEHEQDKKSLIKNVKAHEEDSIKYVDESDDVFEKDLDYENCDNARSDKYETYENDSDDFNIANEFNSDLKNPKGNALDLEKRVENKEQTSSSEVLYGHSFKAWSSYNYVKRKCPVCNYMSKTYGLWRVHIQRKHLELMEAADVNFDIINNSGVCKICKQEFRFQFSRFIHSINHTRNSKLELNICKLCNYAAIHSVYVNNHIAQKHPEVIKEFEKSCCMKQNLKCPLCFIAYNKINDLMYHFKDRHPKEYLEKLLFNCNLCHHDSFSGEELFLQHLMEEHELNSWQVLNFQKMFDDKEYVSCLKCHRLYFKNDVRELLKHSLQHKSDCYWTCKFCCKQFDHSKSKVRHLCSKMINYFEKKQKQIKESINLKEFEEYISHVCPFCEMEFGKMIKWQHHLRTEHQIDTLKGLEMKIFANSSDKLMCTICHTVVVNIPEHLHAHRFQHLPYLPYKCLQCAQTLDNFKTAVNHVLKRCQDEEDRYVIQIKNYDYNSGHSLITKQCPLCTNQIFSDWQSVFKHYRDEHNMFKEFFIKNPDMSVNCIICKKQYAQYDKIACFNHLHIHFDEKSFKCSICQKSYVTLWSCNNHLNESHLVKNVYKKVSKTVISNVIKIAKKKVNKTINNEVNKNVKKKKKIVNKEVSKKVKSNKKIALESEKEKHKVCNVPKKRLKISLDSEKKKNKVCKMPKKPELCIPTEFAEFVTYACPECNEDLSTQEEWYTHNTTQHNFFETSNIYFKDNDGSLKCTTCKKKLTTSITKQQTHKLTHMKHRPFICKLCYNRCNTLIVLCAHLRRKHFTPGNFECPICSKTLGTSNQRTEHLKKNHPFSEWPEVVCLICYHIAKSKTDLSNHMDIHDRGRSSYNCYLCSLKLIGIKDFMLHMETHYTKNEIKENEKMVTDIASHSGSKNHQSHDDMDEKNKRERCDQVSATSEKQTLHKRTFSNNSSAENKSKKLKVVC